MGMLSTLSTSSSRHSGAVLWCIEINLNAHPQRHALLTHCAVVDHGPL